ncbi:MAG: hypothetical protein MZV65_20235 [Chromatiales bacterium]|nr:hypothetical protein [Chromatiales bacterium]
MGLTGLLVRWRESYLIGRRYRPHPGQQSVRSVYPVLPDHRAAVSVLRGALSAPAHMGGFVLLVISRRRRFPAVVHLRSRRARNPAAGAGAAES